MAAREGGQGELGLDELSELKFSKELEAAINEVLPSTDPLDSPDFNPITHINKLFPSEESLSQVDSTTQDLEAQVKALDEDILRCVREQTSAGSSARKDIESGKQSVSELFVKVRDIKTKAEQSEQMVQEICRDIKSLDYAKRHLTQTITALKRLQMLVTAVEQLSVMARERMYSEAASLLQAVAQLLQHFEKYVGIKKIDQLREQIREIKTSLRTQVFEDFNRLSADETGASQHARFEQLSGACAVVDALGVECRTEMISWFCTWQFAPYKHAFQPYGEAGSLDKTELRYSWHRQLLKKYDEQFSSLFPPSWQMAQAVTRNFCKITHKHIEEILDIARGSLDVAQLTHALQKTVEFEKEMHSRFAPQEADADQPTEKLPGKDGNSGKDGNGGKILNSISSAFDSYMGIYVALEDKSLEDGMQKMLAAETWTVQPSGTADTRVFNSSKELFLMLKRQYKRASALNMSAVLHQLLQKVWSKRLKLYAKKVQEKLPLMKQPVDPSQPPDCAIDETVQRVVCAVVNTGEYCATTTEGLAETVMKAVTEEYRDKVDLSADDFNGVVDGGMKVLVAALETRVGASLKAMTTIKWDMMEEIGDDTSPYMQGIVKAARKMMPELGEHLSGKYVTFFCTKFVSNFVPRLIGHIYRCKRIGEVGAQQMQVDVGTLKQTLLDLPSLGQAVATNSYNKMVAHEIGKAEQVLKLVQTPEELLQVTISEMRSTGFEPDLHKILELKGLKKAETEKLLEAYNLAAREGGQKIKKLFNLS
ncbi:hypothetical protein AB1Y20_009447 [Prymnesium parvum]|uniref:Vps53 N-terminal domain-containing protein n=1 Tax=Prymnesium parvum TaxID=97485 RepID=A0AB34K1H0_PRYPA